MKGRKIKSRDCALASDLVRAAPAPRAKRKIQRIVDVHRPSTQRAALRGAQQARQRLARPISGHGTHA